MAETVKEPSPDARACRVCGTRSGRLRPAIVVRPAVTELILAAGIK